MIQFPRTLRLRLVRAVSAAAIVLPSSLLAQDTITIGTGTESNDFFSFPAPYGNAENGSRHQMLILASELQAAGMGSGEISSVAFEVAEAAFIEFDGFTVAIGTTAETEMTPAWIGGLTTVWGPQNYINDQAGWNTHPFDAPFVWDGVSNLVVQTCFSNAEAGLNAQHLQSLTAFNSTVVRSTNNANVCTANMGQLDTYAMRPNMRFEWTSLQIPPEAAFSQSTTATCSGIVQFQDLSGNFPTGWAWDFGDATTDSVQNPEHQYTTDGVYTPFLIATNAYGSDTVYGQPITVSANGPQPMAAACTPLSNGLVAGFGILNVTIGTNSYPSPDALTEGYADRGCQLDTVLAGTLLNIAVETGTVTTHNIRAWVDWDNSGDFIGGELVLSANSQTSASASVAVPVFAVLDIPLRVRVMADYDFSAFPDPCTDPEYGQAEDYGLVVVPNPTPPEAGFSATPLFSCDGSVQFTDGSFNTPTSWDWDFGDSGSSDQQSPVHVYLSSNVYTVTLIVSNAYGSDTLTQTGLVNVDLSGQLVPVDCEPATTGYCCGFGITSVEFAGINSTSPDGVEGYVDRSCGNVAQVDEGSAYPIAIGTGGDVAHDVVIWMDLDNSGDFSAVEEVWSALDQQDPSGTLIMPAGSVFGVPVRMRITADVVGEVGGPCDPPLYGQTEDFTVIISPNPNPPTASFSASPTSTCTGYVQFTDQSLNAPTIWSWAFGDGDTSEEQSPLHLYDAPGTYSVTFTATNANGSDTEIATDLINFVAEPYCDTIQMPGGFQDVLNESCEGVLADDGGPSQDYSPGQGAAFTIAPIDAEVVTLVFSQFEFEDGFDYLRIYDGPDVFSPEIGNGFTGSGIGQLPNNGVIMSTGPSITLQQDASMGPTTWEGFVLTWNCSFTGVRENNSDPIGNIWPQPAQDRFTVGFGREAGAGWNLVLRDALGRMVKTIDVDRGASERIFDTTGMSAGSYLLSVETPQGRWNRTVIIR